MDMALSRFFRKIDISDQVFEMENDQGMSRKFSINWDEGLLQGRGIKGFFARYSSDFLTIEYTEDDKIKVSTPVMPPSDTIVSKYRNKEHTTKVISSIVRLTNIPEKWFQLYQISKIFKVGSNDSELICLPYVREIEPFDYQINTVK